MLRLSPGDIYKKLDEGEIPAYRDKSTWKIPMDTLREYVNSRAREEAENRKKITEELKGETENEHEGI